MAAIAVTALIDGLWLDLTLGKAPVSPEEADDLATYFNRLLFGYYVIASEHPCGRARL